MSKNKRVLELFLFDIYVAILKIEKIIEKFNTPESLFYDDDLPEFKSAIVNSIKSINNALKKQLIDSYVEMNKHLNFIVNELERLKG
jgi:hypothetical protein